MFDSKVIFVLLLTCVLAVAQDQLQATSNGQLSAGICNATTTKPTPATKTYHYANCIVAKFAAYLTIGEGKYIELNDGIVDTNRSHCDNSTAPTLTDPILVFNFTCGQLEFEMAKNNSKIYVKSINGYYNITMSNQTVQHSFTNSTPLFETSESGHYYKCNTEQAVNMTPVNQPPQSTSGIQLLLSNFAYEAFRTVSGTDFYGIPEECALDAGQVSDLVRIGVGICLVALVVIVLIAYFVGRRRWSERSSYESV